MPSAVKQGQADSRGRSQSSGRKLNPVDGSAAHGHCSFIKIKKKKHIDSGAEQTIKADLSRSVKPEQKADDN